MILKSQETTNSEPTYEHGKINVIDITVIQEILTLKLFFWFWLCDVLCCLLNRVLPPSLLLPNVASGGGGRLPLCDNINVDIVIVVVIIVIVGVDNDNDDLAQWVAGIPRKECRTHERTYHIWSLFIQSHLDTLQHTVTLCNTDTHLLVWWCCVLFSSDTKTIIGSLASKIGANIWNR